MVSERFLTAEGVRILRTVADRIEAQPDTYDHSQWCGTACCISGHMAAVVGVHASDDSIRDYLTSDRESHGRVMRELFLYEWWAEPYRTLAFGRYRSGIFENERGRADIAAQYLRAYCDLHGPEELIVADPDPVPETVEA